MRERPQIEARFYETYYFANVIRNVLNDQFAYLRNLDEFYGDLQFQNFVAPFPKYSAFHCFIEFIVEDLMFGELNKVSDLSRGELPINRALKYHEIDHQSFEEWLKDNSLTLEVAHEDDALEYFQELRLEGPVETLLERTVAEVFFVMFGNRGMMQIFNDMMAGVISGTTLEEVPEDILPRFKGDGVLRRVHIPKWAQRAVFYRDRGSCVLCQRDISGQLNIGSVENFDHIVPLARGGLNDVANLQLLCAECNRKKSDGISATSHIYETWY